MFLFNLRNRHFLLLDLLVLACIPTLALALRLELAVPMEALPALLALTLIGLLVKLPVFYSFQLYNRYWRYASMDELINIAVAAALAGGLVAALFYAGTALGLISATGFPRSVPLLDMLFTLLLVGGTRFAVRAGEHQRSRRLQKRGGRPVLIVGAGDAGQMLARELRTSPRAGLEPVGFVDDDPAKQGMSIHGVPVLGTRGKLAELIERCGVREVLIAMPSAPGKLIREIVAACEAAGVPSRTLPGIAELVSGQASITHLRPVAIEDLLRREPVVVDMTAVTAMLAGRRVLVTGAGGSIGAELCRQIARCGPAQLIAVGHGENSLFALAAELNRPKATGPVCPLETVVADIRDRPRLEAVFARFRPELVFHAAAHKHVPLMESNAEDAVTNNILGTRHVAEVAEAYQVARLVLISSDKAVNPSSIMGVTKRVAELVVTQVAHRCGRPFVAVRFGNVLGSRGSVVPTFHQQIAAGGPVTITHRDMQRYFMTIPEAVLLVLQAAVLGEAGRVFVLDMGEPVKLVDLAEDLIKLSGLQVGRDIDLTFTGLRPGEKLFEELFGGQEPFSRTTHQKIFVAPNGDDLNGHFNQHVDKLIEAAQNGQPDQVRHWLKVLVPEFAPHVSGPVLVGAPGPLPVALAQPAGRQPGD